MLYAAKGDSLAFAKLYMKYMPLVRGYLRSLGCHEAVVPDVTQEAFMRVWTRRQGYRGTSTFKTYIFSYAKRVLLEEWRSRVRAERLTDHLSRDFLPAMISSSDPETEAWRTELEKLVECALARLSVEQRQVVRRGQIPWLHGKVSSRARQTSSKDTVPDYFHLGR